MKHYFYSLFVATLCLSACSDDVIDDPEANKPNDQKECISFTVSDAAGGQTRFATRASANPASGFTSSTQIVARFESSKTGGTTTDVRTTRTVLTAAPLTTYEKGSYSTVTYSDAYIRYWDDAYGRYGNISVYAVAVPNMTNQTNAAGTVPNNTLEKLVNYSGVDASTSNTVWKTDKDTEVSNNNIAWVVTNTTAQSAETMAAEDLCYSNNIQTGGKNGRYVWGEPNGTGDKYPDYDYDYEKADEYPNFLDGPLSFKSSGSATAPGHFDKGHLIFKHALSRLSVTLKEGTGFDGTTPTAESTDQDFQMDGNIRLQNFPYTGTLNIKSGEWTSTTADADHPLLMYGGSAYDASGVYSAHMLPGFTFAKDNTTNVMEFVIDDNTYYITQGMIYDALTGKTNVDESDNKITMTQGKHYKLEITVNKTKIDNITATLADWVDVAGTTAVNNSHLTFTLSANGDPCDKDIDLYRLEDVNIGYATNKDDFSYKGYNWKGNYLTDAKHKTELLQENVNSTTHSWTTPWFFESNKEYYHFRTVNKGEVIKGNTGTDANDIDDYFEIHSDAISYDPHWGAPMDPAKNQFKYNESDNKGFSESIQYAIGATESQIAIQEIHMTSRINVILQTPAKADGTPADNAIVLMDASNNKTEVAITKFATTGKVYMGTGYIEPAATYTDIQAITTPATYWATDKKKIQTQAYTYAVVPQALVTTSGDPAVTNKVGLRITTPDNNTYYVIEDLSKITVTKIENKPGAHHAVDELITRWYPGHSYTYTITLTKTGIENITCTVAEWVEVVGSGVDISLEN